MRVIYAIVVILAALLVARVQATNLLNDNEFAEQMTDVNSLISSAESAANTLDALDNGAPVPPIPSAVEEYSVPEGAAIPALVSNDQLTPARKIKVEIRKRRVGGKKSAPKVVEASTELEAPLVDRGAGQKRSRRYSVVASLDGAGGEQKKVKNLPKAKNTPRGKKAAGARKAGNAKIEALQRAADKAKAEAAAKLSAIPDREDEVSKLDRLQKRMARLIEKISEARPDEPLEVALQRKHSYLGLYEKMKGEAKELIESYALRTGSSVLGDAPIDPALKAYLPPNSLAAILDHYTRPSNVRERESPKEVMSYTDAQRIQFKIDTFKALRDGKAFPQDPFAPPFIPRAIIPYPTYQPQAKGDNVILARQEGDWGNGRPVLTAGNNRAGTVGDVHVHLVDEFKAPVVSNTLDTRDRALPFNVSTPFYESDGDRIRYQERLIASKRTDSVEDQKFY